MSEKANVLVLGGSLLLWGLVSQGKADVTLDYIIQSNGSATAIGKVTDPEMNFIKSACVCFPLKKEDLTSEQNNELSKTGNFYVDSKECFIDKQGFVRTLNKNYLLYKTVAGDNSLVNGVFQFPYRRDDRKGFQILFFDAPREVKNRNAKYSGTIEDTFEVDDNGMIKGLDGWELKTGEDHLLPVCQYGIDINGVPKYKVIRKEDLQKFIEEYKRTHNGKAPDITLYYPIDEKVVQQKRDYGKKKRQEDLLKQQQEDAEKKRQADLLQQQQEEAKRKQLEQTQLNNFNGYLTTVYANIFDAYNAATTDKNGRQTQGIAGIEPKNTFQTKHKTPNRLVTEKNEINSALTWIKSSRAQGGFLDSLKKAKQSNEITEEQYNSIIDNYKKSDELVRLVNEYYHNWQKQQDIAKRENFHMDNLELMTGIDNFNKYGKYANAKFNLGFNTMNGLFQFVLENEGIFGKDMKKADVYAGVMLGKYLILNDPFFKEIRFGGGMGLEYFLNPVFQNGEIKSKGLVNFNPILRFSLFTEYGNILLEARPAILKGFNSELNGNKTTIGAHEFYEGSIEIFPVKQVGLTGKVNFESTEIDKGKFQEQLMYGPGAMIRLNENTFIKYEILFGKDKTRQSIGIQHRL